MRFAAFLAVTMASGALAYAAQQDNSFIANLNTITSLTSTLPANQDVNPYGVAIVPVTTGALVKDDILVSNFNNSSNLQGTGTTIVEISPLGALTLFATIDARTLPGSCPGGVGLTTALVALRSGFVVVGSLPTTDGTAATAQAGCLIVLDSNGNPVLTISDGSINGPWDMTALDFGSAAVLFVTNVLNGTVAAGGKTVDQGTVVRIVLATPAGFTPHEIARAVIADGFQERTDPAALVIGPTGVAFSPDGTLFVADPLKNRIAMIPDALSRSDAAKPNKALSQNGALNGPLGLALAPSGDLIAVNSNDGNMIDISPAGRQVAVKAVDVSNQGAGTLFGLAIGPDGKSVYYVDDGNNTLNLLH